MGKEATCVWSIDGLHFSPSWTWYTKGKSSNYYPMDGTYVSFPGLKYTVKKGNGVEKDQSLEKCQADCDKRKGCTSFSYAKTTKSCVLHSVDAVIDRSWNYFEKPAAKIDREEMARLQKRALPKLKKKAMERKKKRDDKLAAEKKQKRDAKIAAERKKKIKDAAKEVADKKMSKAKEQMKKRNVKLERVK